MFSPTTLSTRSSSCSSGSGSWPCSAWRSASWSTGSSSTPSLALGHSSPWPSGQVSKSFCLPIQLIDRCYPFNNTKFSRYIRIKNKNDLENDNQKKSFSVWCEKLLMAFLVDMNWLTNLLVKVVLNKKKFIFLNKGQLLIKFFKTLHKFTKIKLFFFRTSICPSFVRHTCKSVASLPDLVCARCFKLPRLWAASLPVKDKGMQGFSQGQMAHLCILRCVTTDISVTDPWITK